MSDGHGHSPEPESSSPAGFAAIKYTAIVIIVLAILAFIAWYIIPAFNWTPSRARTPGRSGSRDQDLRSARRLPLHSDARELFDFNDVEPS